MASSLAPPSTCLNCDHPLATPGHYCPQCGQPPAHRLSTHHVLHELLHVFTHADKGIFAYLPKLLLRPGEVYANYLTGRRKRYYNPFQFLLIVVGFAAAGAALLHYYDGTGADMQRRMARHFSPEQLARVGNYFRYLGKYQNLWWLLLLLPMYALVTWAVYRSKGINYAEAFFMHVLTGSAFHCYLLLLWSGLGLFHVKALATSNLSSGLQLVVILLYLVLIGRQGLALSWPGALWRAVLAVALGALTATALNMLAFRLYVVGH